MVTRKKAATKKSGPSSSDTKPKVRWPFPRSTLEQALQIPLSLKDKNGGNPWEPEEVRKAIGAGTGGNAFFYLTAASRDYGLTVGTNSAEKIELTELGREVVYAPNAAAEQQLKIKAFLNIELFKRVLDYYKGSNLPEMRYLGNTLQKEFGLQPETHEEFSRLLRENCQYLGTTSGTAPIVADEEVTGVTSGPEVVTLAEATGASRLKAFVIMPVVERDAKHSPGFFAEVLRSLITPAAKEATSLSEQPIAKAAT